MTGILVFLRVDGVEQAGHFDGGYESTSSCLRKSDDSNRRIREISGDFTCCATPVEHLPDHFDEAIGRIGMVGSLGGMNLLDIPGGDGRYGPGAVLR